MRRRGGWGTGELYCWMYSQFIDAGNDHCVRARPSFQVLTSWSLCRAGPPLDWAWHLEPGAGSDVRFASMTCSKRGNQTMQMTQKMKLASRLAVLAVAAAPMLALAGGVDVGGTGSPVMQFIRALFGA